MKNKNLFNRKGLKSFRSFLRNKATSAEAALWEFLKSINQPPRPQPSFAIYNYISTAATPPSKGGETFSNLSISNSTLRLTAMGWVGSPLGG